MKRGQSRTGRRLYARSVACSHTETHLYYGCEAFDPEPEKIRARYTDRDRSVPQDDTIGLGDRPVPVDRASRL